MNASKLFLFIPLFLFSFYCQAQFTIIITNEGNITGISKEGDQLPTYFDGASYGIRNGKIKSIGDINFVYFDGASYGIRNGLIKSIGTTTFEYFDGSSYGIRNGKIRRINDTVIEYYDGASYGAKNGKIRKITAGKSATKVQLSIGLTKK